MLVVFGSIVLDTIHTPHWDAKDTLGGSSTYAALSASRFTKTHLLSAAGTDFPKYYEDMLKKAMDTAGLESVQGDTFRYEARYEDDFATRVDMGVSPNAMQGHYQTVPEIYRGADMVYLANTDPLQQMHVLRQFDGPDFVMCDTIGHWIGTQKDDVKNVMEAVDAVIVDITEARNLTGERSPGRCARTIMGWGPAYVIIKKAEHGSILFSGDAAYALPAVPLDGVEDPTGAGDAYAGAVMGYLDGAGSTDTEYIRDACVYGSVMGAFVVGRRGTDGLASLDRHEIEGRAEAFRRMMGTDRLERIFGEQRHLAEMARGDRYPLETEQRISVLCTAMIHEAVELQRLTNWKWWKRPGEFDIEAAREELADVWHFAAQAAIELGMTPQDMLDEYLRKNRINQKRQKDGY